MATPFEIQLLYLVYTGRPSDPAALQGWAKTGLTSSEIVLKLVATSEYQINTLSPYKGSDGNVDLNGLINSYYVRLFNRNAVASEISGWVNALTPQNGKPAAVNIDYLGITIANAALNLTGTDIRATLVSKLAAADVFSAQLAAAPADAALYNGFLPAAIGQNFLAGISPSTTNVAELAAAAIDTLPPQGADFTLTPLATSVQEGNSVSFKLQAYPLNQPPAGKEYSYIINGINGLQASDVVGGLTGRVTTDRNGVAFITVEIKSDANIETNESFNVQVNGFSTYTSPLISVIDTSVAPVSTLQVNPSRFGVSEGDPLTFFITSTNLPAGTVVSYSLSGITSADVSNAPLEGTVTLDANGNAQVGFAVSKDLSIDEGDETVEFVANVGQLSAQTISTITDTSTAAPSAVLTVNQDISGLNIAAPAASGTFTYFGNEETLGQSDQLVRAVDSAAQVTLKVGTQGDFNLINFATDGIQTLELRPSNETLEDTGTVDLQAALGLRNINVSQSQLNTLNFRDIQSVQDFATNINDSFSTFVYNFDANALLGANDGVSIEVRETPIDDVTDEAVGFDFTQGPFNANASIESVAFRSTGAITNVVDQLSVGDALNTLQISGDASLNLTTDLGLPFNSNRRISLIDASRLSRDLTLSYTSILGDNNSTFDVDVLGAAGNNLLTFGTQSPNFPTDFRVVTLNGDDSVTTVGGDDQIDVGEGNNSVVAGNGLNTVKAGAGNDTVSSGNGADRIDVGAGDNSVSSSAGNDRVVSLGGNDTVFAGQGNDFVDAGDGANEVFGDDFGVGAGNDTILTGSGADFIVADAFVGGQVAGAGNDSVVSGAGNDTVYAGSGRNTVDAGVGDDLVVLGTTAAGGPIPRTPRPDTFANSVSLGEGNDRLRIDTDSLTNLDFINGGEGIDTVELFNGGVLLASETLRVSRVEALDLRGFGDYAVTLSNELVRTSDEFVDGSRRFSVFTSSEEGEPFSEPAGNVTLDLSLLTPVDAQGNLLSILYSGQSEPLFEGINIERVIIRDGLINDQTVLQFGEATFNRDETFADVLQVIDSVDVTSDDLVGISGLEVIELGSSANGPQTFTFDLRNLSLEQFNRLVEASPSQFEDDVLIIRATQLLTGEASTLNLDLRGAAAGISGRIRIEQSAKLNVFVQADPGFVVPVTTALFYTFNADNLQGTVGADTFTAFQLADVQAADSANGFRGIDTLDLRFAVSNPAAGASLAAQLSNTNIEGIEIFRFNPAAVNQAVQFEGIGVDFAEGLQSIFTSGGSDVLLDVERFNLFIDTAAGNDRVDIDERGTVVTGTGSDSVNGSEAADSIVTGEGNDSVVAEGGNDFVDAGEDNDFIDGGAGDDTIFAGDGNNTVVGGEGDDFVTAFDGNDSIVTGVGNDTVQAGNGANTVSTGAGVDFVVTGDGNDSISTADANGQVDDDTVASGDGNDRILVGLGDDSVDAGLGNDFIVLGAGITITLGTSYPTEAGGYSLGDRLNGGEGVDTVSLASTDDLTLSGVQLQNIESVIVLSEGEGVDVTVSTDLFPGNGQVENGQSVLNIQYTQGVGSTGGSVNASELVQGEAINLTMLAVNGFFAVGGAGNDQFQTDAVGTVFVQGNGGSDSINLSGRNVDTAATIIYTTGNDGGTGGSGAGGDSITGYVAANDQINITGGLLTGLGGVLTLDVTNSQLVLGTLGIVDPFFGLITPDTGRNILNLTGPARSLTDAQLFNAEAIAENINAVGVVGNGTTMLDPEDYDVISVTNQALIMQQGQTSTALYLYTESSFDFSTARAYTVQANELRQLAVFNNALITGTELTV